MRNLVVTAALQSGAVFAHQQAGIRIDAGHPLDRPFERAPLRLAPRDLMKLSGLPVSGAIDRARLVVVPAAVVKHGGAHHGFIGLRPRENPVAPMGRALARDLGVVGLGDQNERAVGSRPVRSCLSTTRAGAIALLVLCSRTCAEAAATGQTRAHDRVGDARTWRALVALQPISRDRRLAGCHCLGAGSLYCGPRCARRDGRVAEGARLESVYTGNRIVGSNPTPSATM